MLTRVLHICCFALLVTPLNAQPREWRDASGSFSIEAEYVRVSGDSVTLRRASGEEISVKIQRLSDADRRHLRGLVQGSKIPAVDKEIVEILEAVRRDNDLPAMCAAVVSGDGLLAHGVTGVRKRGSRTKAGPNDLWHLGSNTKAITATLCAKLVEQGLLDFDATASSKLGSRVHPSLKPATLTHLLSHQSGLPANLALEQYYGLDGRRERNRAVITELAKPPAHAPGSQYLYSNLGYIVAGAVVEKVTGKSWQANMKEHVFEPLGMSTAGFGGLGTPGKVDQPWPHQADGRPVAQNGPRVDNPPVMGPAGRVHCTIHDWSKFIADLLRGLNEKPSLLDAASYNVLVTVPQNGDDYALGWIVLQRDWGGGTVLQHVGSNTMNVATVWVAPQRDRAFLVCVNQGGDKARKACDEAIVGLLKYSELLE